MTGKRNIVSVAAIGVLSAALTLLAGPPAAQSDELADLRANQELLQKRLDQLSQAPPGAPGPYVPGFGPESRPTAAPVTTGSFPRSFLIPGTETSLRIGGQVRTTVQWYLSGAANGGQLNNQGGQIKHTYQGPYGSVFTAGMENPVADIATTFGNTYIDVNQIPNIATCTANVFPAGTTVQNDLACLGNIAFFSPLQNTMPDWVATARI